MNESNIRSGPIPECKWNCRSDIKNHDPILNLYIENSDPTLDTLLSRGCNKGGVDTIFFLAMVGYSK